MTSSPGPQSPDLSDRYTAGGERLLAPLLESRVYTAEALQLLTILNAPDKDGEQISGQVRLNEPDKDGEQISGQVGPSDKDGESQRSGQVGGSDKMERDAELAIAVLLIFHEGKTSCNKTNLKKI